MLIIERALAERLICKMNFDEIFHFLFETYTGIGVLILAALVLSIVVCAIWERATRKKYVDRGPAEDEWAIFDEGDGDDDDDVDDAEDSSDSE